MYEVLIVDDEQLIREGIRKLISWESYELQVVGSLANGEEALRFLEKHPVDIVITDIKMPYMDGLTLIQQCIARNYSIKFIILSGYADFDLVKRAIKLGIENYLLKPVDEEELNQTLLQTLDNLKAESGDRILLSEGARILRDNIVWRWMTGNISKAEMQDRLQFLDFSIQKNYQVAVINIRGKSSAGSEFQEELLALGEQIKGLVSRMGYAVGLYTVNLIYLLFPYANDNKQRICDTLERIQQMIRQKNLFIYQIGVGDIQKDPYQIYISYHHALQIIENGYFGDNQSLAFYEEPSVDDKVYYDSIFVELTKLENNSDWEDSKYVCEIIDNILSLSKQVNKPKKQMMVTVASTIVSKVFSSILLLNRHLEQEITQLYERLPEINQLNSTKEISAWTKEMVLRAIRLSSDEEKQYSEIVFRMLNYLKKNYDQEISLNTMANDFNMNSLYLGRLFKQETGCVFTDYLNNLRIAKAKVLLLETDMSIAEIAQKVGYWNVNYFFPVFKRSLGVTPAEFRKQASKG